MDTPYLPRIIDSQIERTLKLAGVVVIEGAKACGKTTTGAHHSASQVFLDRSSTLRERALVEPEAVLAGATPRLVDEWQLAPPLWNAARGEVDDRQAKGQFIFTGSATPADDAARHSGAMRFIRVPMRPMSLKESGVSDGSVSLQHLWDHQKVTSALDSTPLDAIADAAVRGGWPSNLDLTTGECLETNRAYLKTISAADIVTVDGIKRDPRKVEALISALGRNTATYVSNRVLQTDSTAAGAMIDAKTITSYLDALTRLWILAEQPAWGGHLRSSARARKASKRHLIDPSLAAAVMGALPEDLLEDREAFGQVFETLVFRDLSIYAQANGLEVQSFQDSNGKEIDAVLVRGLQWAGIEVKTSPIPEVLEAAARNLLSIAKRMTSQPRFLAIITASGYSYTRPDGVHVISIAHLGE